MQVRAEAAQVPVMVKDALAGKHGEYEMVLTNPPFGKKSGVTIVNEAGDEEKQSGRCASRRLLDEHEQVRAARGITGQLPPARLHHLEAARQAAINNFAIATSISPPETSGR